MRTIFRPGCRLMATMGGIVLFNAGLFGCSGIPQQMSPLAQEEIKPGAHHTIAQSYHEQAEANRAEAAKYELRAASVPEYADLKGLVRNSLLTAAQTHRAKAREMEQMASTYEQGSDVAQR